MNEQDALDFLRQNQPMPDDNKLSEALIGKYDDTRKLLMVHPSEEGIRLILNSFGSGDGWGVYQLVEDAIAAVPPDVAVKHLLNSLRSPFVGVRYWSAQISANYNDKQLVEPLRMLLHDESMDVRMAAVIAIEKYIDDDLKNELESILAEDPSKEIRSLIGDILGRES